ncbi:hypothetical protein AGDE_01200 [Angomonas deanei]|uniref:Uncharacterized protein n=1 Tax=Angomonas deanei TaxID=59799 RepID=S9VGK1_9TRYP|nr:hypothetical protein AGDE_04147 [Angomonas deanei]EPY40038.1 hypothetical protein AGDE_03890 [Angomonas deanei]EPY42723.1 hypothetical protein AGDE_01200 [Angomonas deanei]CAD2217033.1 hypothetical protein, conserved [Angomonas deanei]|eukprot:EPY39781.1 hypothetical protein AGDE_04147 [Angomonas deanei]
MSSVYQNLVSAAKRNPSAGIVFGTGVLMFITYWYYASSTRRILLQNQIECQTIAAKAFQECRELIKSGEECWAMDIRSRDAQVRRLELQNVEQTRSVGRLGSAMKTCLIQNDKQ